MAKTKRQKRKLRKQAAYEQRMRERANNGIHTYLDDIHSTMEGVLNDFYQAYRNWLLDGATNYSPFKRDYGLCDNALRWGTMKDLRNRSSLMRLLQEQFEAAGLCTDYPFNRDSRAYSVSSHRKRHHKNKLRRQWVFDHSVPSDAELSGYYKWYRRLLRKFKIK